MELYSDRRLKPRGQRFSADAEVSGRIKMRRRSILFQKKSEADVKKFLHRGLVGQETIHGPDDLVAQIRPVWSLFCI
jgi:hypothetical protein